MTPSRPDIAARRAALFDRFDALGIETRTYEHEAVFTVEQGAALKRQWPGGHSKNLFLKDKKGVIVLISAKDETAIPLKKLHKILDVGRLSFGSADLMREVLGVTPGSVTAFALIHADPARLRFYVDAALIACDPLHFHPLENTATTAIAPEDFRRFVRACGFEPEILDFARLAAEDEAGAGA